MNIRSLSIQQLQALQEACERNLRDRKRDNILIASDYKLAFADGAREALKLVFPEPVRYPDIPGQEKGHHGAANATAGHSSK